MRSENSPSKKKAKVCFGCFVPSFVSKCGWLSGLLPGYCNNNTVTLFYIIPIPAFTTITGRKLTASLLLPPFPPIEYAQVVKMLGNGRLEALCFDGEKRLAHIRGKLRKKVWINQGDIILLSLRDYQDEKGDVILKYSADEARSLKAYGELPESAKINETDT